MSHWENHPEIAKQVSDVIQEVLRVEPARIQPATKISDDLGADSLDIVSLLMALEEAFGQNISDEQAKNLVTVDDVIRFAVDHLASSSESK